MNGWGGYGGSRYLFCQRSVDGRSDGQEGQDRDRGSRGNAGHRGTGGLERIIELSPDELNTLLSSEAVLGP